MIPMITTKDRMTYLAECLGSGRPIAPSATGWTGHDMLALAGAAFAAAQSHGPQGWAQLRAKFDELHGEHQEHVTEEFHRNMLAAMEYYCHLTYMVIDGEWDQHFAPEIKCAISRDDEEHTTIKPIAGFKDREVSA